MIRHFREEILRTATRLAQDPRVLKLLTDPRVMRFAMQVLGARSRAREAWQRRLSRLARQLGFATRAEVRDLERAIEALQTALDEIRTNKSSPPKQATR